MSQNLKIFVKFQKFQLENLVDFENCCKTHIFLQKSVPIQPKTSNVLPNMKVTASMAVLLGFWKDWPPMKTPCSSSATDAQANLGDLYAESGQTFSDIFGKISAKCCSFSAVSAPIFARKYAFCSIFQNLPDYQAEIFEFCHNLLILQIFLDLQFFC